MRLCPSKLCRGAARRRIVSSIAVGVISMGLGLIGGTVAVAADKCNLSAIAIAEIPEHQRILDDPAQLPDPIGAEVAGLGVSDRVEFRMWQDIGGLALVQLYLIDAATRERATAMLGDLTEGFVDNPAVANVRTLDIGPHAVTATVRQGDNRFRARVAEVAMGRVVIAVTTFVDESIDDTAFEEAFLLDVLDIQMGRVTPACLEDDLDLLPPDAESQVARVLGSAVGAAFLLGGGVAALSAIRDRNVRLRWRRRFTSTQHPDLQGFTVTNVASEARRQLESSRLETVAALIGFVISSVSAVAVLRGEPGYFVAIPVGLVAAIALTEVIRRRGATTHQRHRRSLFRMGSRGILAGGILLASWFFFFLGAVGIFHTLFTSNLSENQLAVTAAMATIDLEVYRNMGLYMAFVAFPLAGVLHRLARWVAQEPVREESSSDERPPILLLRSFDDDELKIRIRSHRNGLAERLTIRRRERFEESLAWMLEEHGPIITIGDPERRRARIGAPRVWISGPDWLESVRDRLQSVTTVALVVGATEGLLSEVYAIVEMDRLDATLLVIPPLPGENVAARWDKVAEVLDIDSRLSPNDEETVLITLGDSKPRAFVGEVRDAVTYHAAFDLAFAQSPARATPGEPD